MSLIRIKCPECGAGLKSSTGFTPGQSVSCPKCETEFTVEAQTAESLAASNRAGGPDDFVPGGSRGANHNGKEWSYKNSWLRYAVLGVLIVALGVLGYMLYDKKMTERKESANTTPEGRGIIRAEPPGEIIPLGPGPVGAGAGGAPKPKGKTEPKGKTPTMDEVKKTLVGIWETKRENENHTIDYNANGMFSYAMEKEGQPKKVVQGQWKLVRVEQAMAAPVQVIDLHLEWTPDGKPTVKEIALLKQDGTLGHPLLDREIEGKKSGTTFTKKK